MGTKIGDKQGLLPLFPMFAENFVYFAPGILKGEVYDNPFWNIIGRGYHKGCGGGSWKPSWSEAATCYSFFSQEFKRLSKSAYRLVEQKSMIKTHQNSSSMLSLCSITIPPTPGHPPSPDTQIPTSHPSYNEKCS